LVAKTFVGLLAGEAFYHVSICSATTSIVFVRRIYGAAESKIVLVFGLIISPKDGGTRFCGLNYFKSS
jgi:hypothetical protein